MVLFCSGVWGFFRRKTFHRGTGNKFLKRKKFACIFVEKVHLNCTKTFPVSMIKVHSYNTRTNIGEILDSLEKQNSLQHYKKKIT